MKRYILFIAILAVVFQSCEKIVEFNGTQEEPKLVLNSLAQTDSSLTVHLSLSRFFLSNASFPDVNDATVLLYVNGTEMTPYSKDAKGHYGFLYKGTPGDSLTVVAKTAEGKEVKAGTRVPQRPVISDVVVYPDRYTETDIDGSWTFDVNTVRFKLKDRPNERNYYRLTVHYVDTIIQQYRYSDPEIIYEDRDQFFYCSDIALIGSTDVGDFVNGSADFYDKVLYFTDDLIDGRNYEIVIHLDRYNNVGDYYTDIISNPHYRITLESLTEEYYRYRQAVISQDNSEGLNFFVEPTTIPTNVEGGLGIFAASSTSIQWIDVPSTNRKHTRK